VSLLVSSFVELFLSVGVVLSAGDFSSLIHIWFGVWRVLKVLVCSLFGIITQPHGIFL